jgi:hypothetical protein
MIRDLGYQLVRWTWTDVLDGTMVRRLTPIVGVTASTATARVIRLRSSTGG